MSRENQTNRRPILNRIKEQPLTAIIFVSVLLRVAVAVYMGNEVVELPGIFDQVSYHNLALRVLGGHGFTFGEIPLPSCLTYQPEGNKSSELCRSSQSSGRSSHPRDSQ